MTEIFTADTLKEALMTLRGYSRDGRMLVVCDSRFAAMLDREMGDGNIYAVDGGECCKTPEEVLRLWQWLTGHRAMRSSLLTVIGGGSVTDMAGFSASCFKRGIDTAYIPTTLLSAADAAIGGKTGINFCGLKNEIGSFHQPVAIGMLPALWQSLPYTELASGYGEILKTALLQSAEATEQVLTAGLQLADRGTMTDASRVAECARFKQSIVEQDPLESGLRKILNLGHTFAHAFESMARRRQLTLTHGHAVAIGLVAMAALSVMTQNLDGKWVERVASIVKEVYPPFVWRCDDFDELYGYMLHDKKNTRPGSVSFTLLRSPGIALIDMSADRADVKSALEIAADMLF